jgi:hypothetical protein
MSEFENPAIRFMHSFVPFAIPLMYFIQKLRKKVLARYKLERLAGR